MSLQKFIAIAFIVGIATIGLSRFTDVAQAQTSDLRVKHALQLVELGNPAQAVEEMTTLIAAEPKNADAHAALAIAELSQQKVIEAATEVQTAFDLDRRSVLVRTARGMVYGKQGSVQDALKEFNQALKLNDKEVGAYLALSRYYLTLDSNKQAEVTLYRAEQANDKDVRSYLGLAELYEKQHSTPLAIEQYEAAKKLDPTDVIVLARLAALYRRSHQYTASVNEWIKLLRIDSTYAPAYFEIGSLFFLAENYASAASFAQKYLQFRPDDLQGNWLLARSLTKNNQFAQALIPLQKVGQNDSLKSASQLLLAQSYFYSKEYPKAITAYQSAKSLGAEDLDFYGRSLFLNGDTVQAIEKMKASLAINDSNRSETAKRDALGQLAAMLQTSRRFVEAGDVYASMASTKNGADYLVMAAQMYNLGGKRDTAQTFYENAIRKDSTSLKAYAGLGSLLLQKEPTSPRMKEIFAKVVTLAQAKENKEYIGVGYWGLGQSAFYAKDFDQSAENFLKALSFLDAKSPYFCSTTLSLAVCYHNLKKYEQAVEYYKKALVCDPKNETVQKSIKNLSDFLKGKPTKGATQN